MVDDSSAAAIETAVARCLNAMTAKPESVARLEPTVGSFGKYLDARRVGSLDEATGELVAAFVSSRLQSGREPSLATQHNRRTALRMLFRAARQLELAVGDPTVDVVLPPADSVRTRPLTNDEVERCRDVAHWSSSQVAAAWALAEATARGAEIALVTVHDIDVVRAIVDLPGGARTEPRRAELTEWGAAALGRRLRPGLTSKAVAFSGTGAAAGQASTCRAISNVLVRAGLGGQPDVRPASVAGWAGRRVFDRTSSVEAAALAMGVRSLDRAARLIGLDWSADA